MVSEFAKKNDAFGISVGSMNGQLIDSEAIKKLASLASRDELLAQLAATLLAPLGSLARTLNEIPTKFVRAVSVVRDNEEAA